MNCCARAREISVRLFSNSRVRDCHVIFVYDCPLHRNQHVYKTSLTRFATLVNESIMPKNFICFLCGKAECSHTCHSAHCFSVLMVCAESHAGNQGHRTCHRILKLENQTECGRHEPHCVSKCGILTVDMPRNITINLSDLSVFCTSFPSSI